MSRGRKAKSNNSNLGWQQVFSKNVGKYLQYAIMEFSKVENHAAETGQDLLKRIKEEKGKNKKEKELPAIKASEIPYEIPKNWVWCRLGEIIEFTENLNIETQLPADTLISYVDIDAIDNKKYIIRESKLKPVSELSSRARRVLKKGYIVYSLVRPYLNNIAIVEDEKPNYIGSTGFAVFNGILVDNRYLKLFLLSDYIRELYLGMFSGFNSPSITQDQFASTLIPLPPLNIQTQIVDFLTDFENENLKEDGYYFNEEVEQKVIALHETQLKGVELANELTHQLTLVKSLRQQLLQDAVQGKLVAQHPEDEPASVLLEKIKAEKEKLIAEKKIKKEKPLPPIKPEEIPFEIPGNWVWCRLGEMVSIKSGKRIHAADYRQTGIPFLRSGEIGSLGRGEKLKTELFISELLYNEIKQRFGVPKAGDILIACIGGSIGNTWVVDEREFYFKDGNLVLIETIPLLDKNFLLMYLKSSFFWKNTILNATDSSYNALTIVKLNDAEFPLPPLSEQARIVEKLEALMQYCDGLEAGIQESVGQNEWLLQQVLREALRG